MGDGLAAKRAEILEASLHDSHAPRWGYFGVSGPLAIGDDSLAPRLQKKVPVDEGAETTRNIQTNPCKKGATPNVYFSFAPPLCLGDLYIDPMLRTKKPKLVQLDPECSFKPAGSIKYSTNTIGFEYIEQKTGVKDPLEVAAKYKDYMPPRNVYTAPSQKGGGGVLTAGVLFGMDENRRFPEHMPDDYDSARKQRLKELEEHRSMLQEASFKSTVFGCRNFSTDFDTYQCDEPRGIPREPKVEQVNKVAHEVPFRPSNPSKAGINACLGAFPEHMPDPIPEPAKRVMPEEGKEPPPAWRPCHPRQSCNPMPSVVSMTRNMRAERPSVFMRPNL